MSRCTHHKCMEKSVFNTDYTIRHMMDKIANLEKTHNEDSKTIKSLEGKLQETNKAMHSLINVIIYILESGHDLSCADIQDCVNPAIVQYARGQERDAKLMTELYTKAQEQIKALQYDIRILKTRDNYHDNGSTPSGQPTITQMQQKAERKEKNAEREPKKPGPPVGTKGSSRKWNFESVERLCLSTCPQCGSSLCQTGSYNKGMLRLMDNRIHEIMYVVYKYTCENGHTVSSKPDWMMDGTCMDYTLLSKVMEFRDNHSTLGTLSGNIGIAWEDCHISEAAILNALSTVSPNLLEEYNRIGDSLRKADTAGIDETIFAIEDKRGRIWGSRFSLHDVQYVYFQAALSRGRKVLENMVPPTVPATTDRYAVYVNYFDIHQLCWAHVKTKVKNGVHKNDTPESRYLYGRLMDIFYYVKTLSPDTSQSIQNQIISEIISIGQGLLNLGIKAGTYVINCASKLLTAVSHTELTFTNNPTEQAVRPVVIMRKLAHRFATLKGAQEYCIMATCLNTWRLQGKKPRVELLRLLAT